MQDIKFGTDGWRAIIGKDFTCHNVSRVSLGVAEWLNNKYQNASVVIGYDCRFGSKMFAEVVAKTLSIRQIKVYISNDFVSTPMVSLGVLKHKANLGIVITASHNPASYNGYKLKGDFGGPLLPDDIGAIEELIPQNNTIDLDLVKFSELVDSKDIIYTDLEQFYCKHVESNFDLDLINKSSLKFAYDAMFGAGRNVVKFLLPKIHTIHCDENPGFLGIPPEPIHRNLKEFSALIQSLNNIDCGFATDGDADRIGLYDNTGNFVDSHHIILLLIHYLVKYKGLQGKIVTAFSCSVKVNKLCQYYGLEHETVKIGFKHIAGKMISEDVLLGGEESGGIAISTHIPERDGVWMGLILFEFMAKSKKSLNDLIQEVYDIVGTFAFERIDLHIDNSTKQQIISNCQSNKYNSFGRYKVKRVENIDGFKFFFNDDTWLMIRPSGTEPVLRTYAEAETQKKALQILNAAKKTILAE